MNSLYCQSVSISTLQEDLAVSSHSPTEHSCVCLQFSAFSLGNSSACLDKNDGQGRKLSASVEKRRALDAAAPRALMRWRRAVPPSSWPAPRAAPWRCPGWFAWPALPPAGCLPWPPAQLPSPWLRCHPTHHLRAFKGVELKLCAHRALRLLHANSIDHDERAQYSSEVIRRVFRSCWASDTSSAWQRCLAQYARGHQALVLDMLR